MRCPRPLLPVEVKVDVKERGVNMKLKLKLKDELVATAGQFITTVNKDLLVSI